MIKLSVAIATYNEEDSIGTCLDSVTGWSDEIILVDGNSRDRTAEIARSKGAKVISVPNEVMFHKNKQLALEKSTGTWILQLDADEIVTPQLKKEILETLESSKQGIDLVNGYWIPRKNLFLGIYLKKGGQYPDYTLRLYRNGKARLPCKNVHEQAEITGKTSYLKNDLLHEAYPSFSRYLDHFNRYTSILAREMEDGHHKLSVMTFINYFIFKPVYWFLLTFIRHKGFADGFPGFVFSLFSSFRFPVAYIKYWEKVSSDKKAKTI